MGPLVVQVNLHGVEEITIDDRGLLAGKYFALEENLANIEPIAQKMTERAAGERDASDRAPGLKLPNPGDNPAMAEFYH